MRLHRGDVAAEDSIKFSTTSGSGENLVDTGGRCTAEAGYSPHVHSSVMPFLLPSFPLACLRSRINYARYLHTKRPGKIKNTNSEREAPRGPISSVLSSIVGLIPRAALSLASFLSRALFLSLSTTYELRPYTGCRFPPKRYRRYRIIAPGHQSCKLPSAESRNHKFSGNQMIHCAARCQTDPRRRRCSTARYPRCGTREHDPSHKE